MPIKQRCAINIGNKPKNYNESEFKTISASGKDYLWATGSKNNVFKCKKPCYDNKWEKVDGKLLNLSGDDKHIWGINDNKIFKRAVDGKGSWEMIEGKLKFIHASGRKYIWGVDDKNNIYKCNKPCNGKWYRVPGGLTQLSSDNDNIWGVNSKGDIYKQNLDDDGKWKKVNGNLKMIDATNMESIYGLNDKNHLYECKKPCNGKWNKIKNNRLYNNISISDNEIWGLCKDQPDIMINNINIDDVNNYLNESSKIDNEIYEKKQNLENQLNNLNDLVESKSNLLEKIENTKKSILYKRNLIILTIIAILILFIFYIKMHR